MSARTTPQWVRCLDCGRVGRGGPVTHDEVYQGAYTVCGNPECGSMMTIETAYPPAPWAARLESWLFWLPCLLTERWFFAQVGGWRERLACGCVNGWYGAGRVWDEWRSEQ